MRERERGGGWMEGVERRKESCFFTAEVTEKDLEPEQKGIYNAGCLQSNLTTDTTALKDLSLPSFHCKAEGSMYACFFSQHQQKGMYIQLGVYWY